MMYSFWKEHLSTRHQREAIESLRKAQSVVVNASAPLESFEHFSLLNRIWIDSVGVVHCQHHWSLPQQVI